MKEDLQCEFTKADARYRPLFGLQNMQFGSPAVKIIPDILVLIFEELVFDSTNVVPYPRPAEDSVLFPRNLHPCLPLSHVCRYWRQVALDSHYLWGILYANCSRRWYDFISERTMNSAPLFLRRNLASNDFNASGLPLKDCLCRFKEIRLDATTTHQARWAQVAIDGDAPMLEALQICVDPYLDLDLDNLGIMPANTKPQLRVLRMVACTVNLGALSLPRLQELVIDLSTVAKARDFYSVSTANLLGSLYNLQSLRFLDLRVVLNDDNEAPPDLTVELPHLAHFSLAVHRWTQLSLLQHIAAPKLKSLRLCCNQYMRRVPVPSPTLKPICQRLFSELPPRQQVSMDLNRKSCRSSFRMSFLPSPSTNLSKDQCHLDLEFNSDEDMLYERDICQCLSLPFGQPRVLSITTNRDISPDFTPTALDRDLVSLLTQVEEVYLGDADAIKIFIAGTQPGDLPAPSGTTSVDVPLPGLKSLTLFMGDEDSDSELQALGSMLAARKDRGVPVDDLTVCASSQLDDDLRYALSRHVSTFKILTDSEYKEYPNFLV